MADESVSYLFEEKGLSNLVNGLDALAKALKEVAAKSDEAKKHLKGVDDAADDAKKGMGALEGGAKGLERGLKAFGGPIAGATDMLVQFGEAAGELAKTSPTVAAIGAMSIGLAGFSIAAVAAVRYAADLTDELEGVGRDSTGIRDANQALDALGSQGQVLVGLFASDVAPAVESVARTLVAASLAAQDAEASWNRWSTSLEIAYRLVASQSTVLGTLTGVFDGLTGALESYGAKADELIADQGKAWTSMVWDAEEAAGAFDFAAAHAETATQALARQRAEAAAAAAAARELAAAQAQVAGAYDRFVGVANAAYLAVAEGEERITVARDIQLAAIRHEEQALGALAAQGVDTSEAMAAAELARLLVERRADDELAQLRADRRAKELSDHQATLDRMASAEQAYLQRVTTAIGQASFSEVSTRAEVRAGLDAYINRITDLATAYESIPGVARASAAAEVEARVAASERLKEIATSNATQAAQIAQQASDAILQIVTTQTNAQIEAGREIVADAKARQSELITQLRDAEAQRAAAQTDSDKAQAEARIKLLEKRLDATKKEEEAAKASALRAFKAQQAAAVANAIIQGLAAAVTTFAQLGFTPWGFAAVAAGAIVTAANVAAIASQPAPELHGGGMAQMPLTADESMHVLSRGEGVLTPRAVQAVGGEAAIAALNRGQAANVAQPTVVANVYLNDRQLDRMAVRQDRLRGAPSGRWASGYGLTRSY